MIKNFLKQLDAPVIWPDRFVIHKIGHQKIIVASKSLSFLDSLSPTQRVVFLCFIYMYAHSTKH